MNYVQFNDDLLCTTQLIDQEYSKQHTLRCAAERNRTFEGAYPFGTEDD